MERLLIWACLLGASLAFRVDSVSSLQGGGPGGPYTMSKRKRDSRASDICQSVKNLLDDARDGITANDLASTAAQIQTAADAYIDAHGGEVPAQEVEDLIAATAQTFGAEATVDALFAEAGESVNGALGAISLTTEAIQGVVDSTVAIVTYAANNQPSENPAKRWTITGGYQHKPGGDSWNVGLSHSWRRGRSVVSKRQRWSGGLNTGFSNDGWEIGGSLNYHLNDRLSVGINGAYSSDNALRVGAGLNFKFRREN